MFGRRRMAWFISFAALLLMAGVLFSKDKDEEQDEPGESIEGIVVLSSSDLLTDEQRAVYASIDSGFQVIKPIFEKSCFDCHSQNTKFPWYAGLPLINGMLNDHITEARKELDMTRGFPFFGRDDQIKMLTKMREEIEEGKMPLWSYRLMHWGTSIEGTRRDSVFAWIDSTVVRLQAQSQ